MKNIFRLSGSLPKVGIRPTIDGRRGVRESLEKQTMTLAKKTSELIESTLKHASGEKIQCVISNTTIGGANESAKCEEQFQNENVQISLTITPSWCYGTETLDLNPLRPKAIWGFNGTERPGAVYLAAAVAGHDQIGLPAFAIYGKDVQDSNDSSIPKDVSQKILLFVKAGIALATIQNKSYLSIGGTSMGIAGSIVDTEFFSDYLCMRNVSVDMNEISRRIEEKIYDKEEFKKALKWVKSNCIEGPDYNEDSKKWSRDKLDSDWEFVIKMSIIVRDMMIGNKTLSKIGFDEESHGYNAIASGFQGQRHWTDHLPNGDFLETILNSSFDWNGIREAFVVATENDSLNGIPMLFGHLLTGTAQIFSDVRTFWSVAAVKRVTGFNLEDIGIKGLIHLINSGSTSLDGTGEQTDTDGNPVMKPYWDITENDTKKCLSSTEFCPADADYFRGGGFSSRFLTKGKMPITMSRINIVKNLGPVLQIAEGYTVEIPKDIHDILDKRTNPTWPTTWFTPILTGKGSFKDVYSVMNNWGANHGAISYGHIGSELITLASMLRIPVSMHNVAEERIFRPKVWNSFGTSDLEGADFRACKSFGPLYKK
ncbi:MAG: L-fucose isomerase [Clostridiales bacterium]